MIFVVFPVWVVTVPNPPVPISPGVGTITVDCAPAIPAGGISLVCDTASPTFMTIALNGLGSLLAPVPGLGRYEVTALALLLFALAVASLRRRERS